MRNVDKIKGLENQLEELKRRNRLLMKEREQLIRASKELQAANNAVMISVAIACGTQRMDGSYKITFPKADVTENLLLYQITAGKDGDNRYILVSPKKEAEGGTDTTRH